MTDLYCAMGIYLELPRLCLYVSKHVFRIGRVVAQPGAASSRLRIELLGSGPVQISQTHRSLRAGNRY